MNKLQILLETASPLVARRLMERTGYGANLKMRVQDAAIEAFRSPSKIQGHIPSLRSALAIANDLERLNNICQDCAKSFATSPQTTNLKDRDIAHFLSDITNGLKLTEKAIRIEETQIALKINNIAKKIQRNFNKKHQFLSKELQKNKKQDVTVSLMLIAHRIHEMGDILIDLSDAILSAKIGQSMNAGRYKSLQKAMDDFGLKEASFEKIAETKSGSTIAGISTPEQTDNDFVAIYKDGSKDKVKEERESVESWHDIYPGLAPQIYKYKKQGKQAAILVEHLSGQTYEDILIRSEDHDLLIKAQKHLAKTLKNVWEETKKMKSVHANHMDQLKSRFPSVLEIHPEFDRQKRRIHSYRTHPLSKLIEKAQEIEQQTPAPFSVYIHGDFNLDNIIYDPESKKIRFIDLHRSTYQDYSQDVSVFMVSNYRLQILDKRTRLRINQSACFMYKHASQFAAKHNDNTFEVRLALGLARSFITSTRFILDKELATTMYLRAIYILEQLMNHDPTQLNTFTLPIEDLFS